MSSGTSAAARRGELGTARRGLGERALGVGVGLQLRLARAWQRPRDDRGDVNGYVFVTLMTAGIVMVIWVVARDRLAALFERALASVAP